MSWKELPIIGTVGVLLIDVLMYGGEFVVEFLFSLGEIIPILSMLSAYVAPQVEWIPKGLISTLLMVSALLYIGVLIGRLVTDR